LRLLFAARVFHADASHRLQRSRFRIDVAAKNSSGFGDEFQDWQVKGENQKGQSRSEPPAVAGG
jgi:hypothetical protein